nr:hypothetical protein [Tanacetum cinerariifolium]
MFIRRAIGNSLDEIHIDDKLYFVEEPVKIMDREVKQLNQSHIPIIKVRWNYRKSPEFTCDEPLAVSLDGLHFDDKLYFVKDPVEIVDRESFPPLREEERSYNMSLNHLLNTVQILHFLKGIAIVLYGDCLLFSEHKELMDAFVRHSSIRKYNRVECWGPFKDAAKGQVGDQIQGLFGRDEDEYRKWYGTGTVPVPTRTGTDLLYTVRYRYYETSGKKKVPLEIGTG